MKQLSNVAYQKLKNDVLTALTETQDNFIKKVGKPVYVAPMDLKQLESLLVRNGYVVLDNGAKLTESGIALAVLCGVEL
jgi:hypothetical protein